METGGYEDRRFIEREETIKTEPLVDFFTPEQISTTMAEYMLSPAIPESERKSFKKFATMFCQIMALTNIERHERIEWICAMKEIVMAYQFGDVELAKNLQMEYLMLAQLSRSIGAMNMLYGMQGVTKTTVEHLEPPRLEKQTPVKKGIFSRLVRGMRGK